MKKCLLSVAAIFGLVLVRPGLSARPSDPGLVEGFRNVPAASRLRMYWRVFGPAWTRPEIDRQLAAMKAAGLGGTTVYFLYPVALDNPGRGILNERFGSPEFLRTLGYAARKAAELGLRFSVNAGTGWPYGGPTVAPPDAAQRLREARAAKGGDPRDALKLAEGETIVAAFLDGRDATAEARAGRLLSPLTGELRTYISGPTGMQVKRAAFGGEGPVLSHYDSGALTRWLEANVRPVLEAAPGLVEGIGCDSLEVYRSNWAPDLPGEFQTRRSYDLVARLPDLFDDNAPAARGLRFDLWRTLAELTEERFTQTLGDWCRRRSVELEMEPYGQPPNPMTAATHISIPTGEHYEWKGFAVERYVASMAHLAGRRIVGAEAWTWAGLPNRLGDSLSDIKLVSDMTFLVGANDLTGVDFPYSPESAGSPGWMPYYGPVMGTANPQWRFFPALVAYLSRCQWMLRQGEPVRRVAVYLPVEDAFAAGPVDQMLLDFAVRDRLATGHPTSEFGLKNGLKHHSDLLHGLIRAGYDFDGLDFWAVDRLGKVKNGRLEVGPAAYEAVILPSLEFMDAAAMERVAEFCRAGGTVVASGRLPAFAPGLGREADTRHLETLITQVFGLTPAAGLPHPWGKGRGIFVRAAGEAAAALTGHVVPSVRMTPGPETVGFAHRRAGDRDIYFFANVGPETARFTAEFPGPGHRLEAWDAVSGAIRRAAVAGSRLEIVLPARGSLFVVSGVGTPDAAPPWTSVEAASPFAAAVVPAGRADSDVTKRDSPPLGTVPHSAVPFVSAVKPADSPGGSATNRDSSPAGSVLNSRSSPDDLAAGAEKAIQTITVRADLNLEWTLSFEGPNVPPTSTIHELVSWAGLPGGRFFSGAGIYRTSFDWTGAPPGRCLLRFEDVREAAEVKLNGRSLGVLFNPPWAVEVGSALRQGRNDLEITVVNLPLNRFLGLPDEDLGPLRAKYGARFSAPEEKKIAAPAPSGLIGAVWLERGEARH